MKKQSEQLFESITDIDDELIEEALKEQKTKRQINWKPILAIAACLALFIAGSSVFHDAPRIAKDIAPKKEVYQAYAGPVLPLTMRERNNDINAVRNINFDFSSYQSEEPYQFYSTISDQYQITNDGTNTNCAEFLYPFTGSYEKLAELLPDIKKDGQNISTELLAGNYTGGFLSDSLSEANTNKEAFNLKNPENWKDYEELLKDDTYVENLFAPTRNLDTTVTVYRFHETSTNKTDNIDLVVDLKFNPEKTKILSYGFNGGSFDDEKKMRTYHASLPQESPQILIVMGDDLESFDVSKRNITSGKSGLVDRKNISRETTTLDSVLRETEHHYMQMLNETYETEMKPDTEEIYYRSFIEMLTEYGTLSSKEIIRYDSSMLEDMLSDAFHQNRVFYLKFALELQPSAKTELDITLPKLYSHNFSCSDKETSHGYDLLTQAGSNLTFTELNASITNTENITILEQNFGFVLENNISSVPLDVTEEHYYLKLQ